MTDEAALKHHEKVLAFLAGKVAPADWDPASAIQSVASRDPSTISALYINLDDHGDPRAYIEEQLEKIAIPYQRVTAIMEAYGPLGCLKSHIKAIRFAMESENCWMMIFEDDFGFQMETEDVRAMLRFISENSTLAPL